MKTKTDLQWELPGTWLCFQNKIWQKQQKPWPILTTMRIGAQKTKARKTNRRSTEYVQGRQRKQSQQNCTPSCKKVGLTLTKISSFQKRRQKKRKKETCKHGGSEFTEIFQVSLWWPFKKMPRNWKTENRHIPNLENDDSMTIYQTVSQTNYHSHECVSALPILH